jgi:hypothetical protein
VILVAAASMAAAATIWAESHSLRRNAALLVLALMALIGANYSGRLIDVVYAKGMFRDPAWVEFARWNALSRVEVDRQGQAKAIVIDADASTYIMNADITKWHSTEWERDLMSAPPALANVLRPHGEFAIIGPGGGVDVLRAIANGSPNVTGIEINPIIATTIMRGRYADYAQHLYDRPDVHIHVTDGRSFLRSTPQHFDVVQMTLVDTWASTAAGAFALSENNLYTVEAFGEYFDHLKPDGMIAITRWEFRHPREALRVVAVAMEALHRMGVANPARNFIVASQGSLDEDGIPVIVLAKKVPFTPAEETAVITHFDHYSQLDPLYLPSQPGQNPFSDLIASNDPLRLRPQLCIQRIARHGQRSFFLLHAEARTDSWRKRSARWHRLESEPGSVGTASCAGNFSGRCPDIPGSASSTAKPERPPVAASSALFRSHGIGLHTGGDRVHSALRVVSRSPNVRPDGRDFPSHALQRRRKLVLAHLSAAHRPLLDTGRARYRDSSRRHLLFARPPGRSGRHGFQISPAGQRGSSHPAGIRYGDAVSHRPACPRCSSRS